MSDSIQIIFTLLWLTIGIVIMLFSNKVKQSHITQTRFSPMKFHHVSETQSNAFYESFGKTLAYVSFLYFMLAAFTIYINDSFLVILASLTIVLLSIVIVCYRYIVLRKRVM